VTRASGSEGGRGAADLRRRRLGRCQRTGAAPTRHALAEEPVGLVPRRVALLEFRATDKSRNSSRRTSITMQTHLVPVPGRPAHLIFGAFVNCLGKLCRTRRPIRTAPAEQATTPRHPSRQPPAAGRSRRLFRRVRLGIEPASRLSKPGRQISRTPKRLTSRHAPDRTSGTGGCSPRSACRRHEVAPFEARPVFAFVVPRAPRRMA
jgi:hypothetical protein